MKDRVLALIDQRRCEIVGFLRQFIAILRLTGEEGEVQAFIARKSRDSRLADQRGRT
jgi:hypothetical protein